MSVVPIVLAAGASSRMGESKPLLDFDGKSALDLVLDAFRGAGLPGIIVVLGHEAERIKAKGGLDGVQVLENPDFDRGQSSSLKVALRALSSSAEAFIVHPADVPLVTVADVNALLAARRVGFGRTIFVPSFNLRRGHPVLFEAPLKEEFLTLADDAPARAVVNRDADRVAYVDCVDDHLLMDMDSPDDYARCLARYRQRSGGPPA